MDAIDAIAKQVQNHDITLGRIEPMVDSHQKILYGDPNVMADQGIVGVLIDINEFVTRAKSWMSKLAMTLIGGLLVWIVKTGLEIYTQYLLIK